MTSVYPLVRIITPLFAIAPVLSPWEMCALTFIENSLPSSVSFICKSSQHCPAISLYTKLQVPSRTLSGLDRNELPRFDRDELVFLVEDGINIWNDRAVEKYRLGGANAFRIVVVAQEEDPENDFNSMGYLFEAMWLSGIVQCAVLLVNNTSSRIYSYIPYKNSSSCEDTTPVPIGGCSRSVIEEALDRTGKILNLNKCPLRVAMLNVDLRLKQYRLRMHFINEVLRCMNASVEFMAPTSGGSGGICGPEEHEGIRGMVFNGTAHLALNEFQQTECATLAYVNLDYTQCISWCTPVIADDGYVFLFLLKQLQPEVWAALLMSAIIVSGSVAILSAASCEHWRANDVFNLALTIYATTPRGDPRASAARMVVILWLLVGVVLRAAYEGEMKSQNAVSIDTHIIHDLEELADSDLMLCTTRATLQILQDVETPIIQKISNKTTLCNGSVYDNIVTAARERDRAILTTSLNCVSAATSLSPGEEGSIYRKTGGCFKMLQMSLIATVPGSPFKARWRRLQHRIVQAGLIRKWIDFRQSRRDSSVVHPFKISHLLPAMFVLGLGYLGGCVMFIVEGLYHKCFQRKPEFELGGCAWSFKPDEDTVELCQFERKRVTKSGRSRKWAGDVIELAPVEGERWGWSGGRGCLQRVSPAAALHLRPAVQVASPRDWKNIEDNWTF